MFFLQTQTVSLQIETVSLQIKALSLQIKALSLQIKALSLQIRNQFVAVCLGSLHFPVWAERGIEGSVASRLNGIIAIWRSYYMHYTF